MKAKLKVIALLSICSVVLTACTIQDLPLIGKYFGSKSSVTSGSITVWGLWEDPQVMQTLIAKFNEQYPEIQVTYEDRSVVDLRDYKERVYTRFSSENPEIDAALVHATWVPRLSPVLAPASADLIDATTYASKFYPSASKLGVVNGSVYGIPPYYDGLVLLYNKAHFREINQTFPPTAWEEFRRLALELTVRSGEQGDNLVRAGAAMGAADNIEFFSDIIGLMWAQAGVNYPSDVDSKPAVDALTFYTNFVREDQVWSRNFPEASTAFVEGRVSMIFVPTWRVLEIIRQMPNLNDVGIAPVPQALPDTPQTWATYWMYAVPKNSTQSQAAWLFINFLGTEEAQQIYYTKASEVRAVGAPYSLVSLKDQIDSSFLRPAIETAEFAAMYDIVDRSGNVKEVDAMKTAVNGVLDASAGASTFNYIKGLLTTAKGVLQPQ